jgi:hypothetical protein
MTNIKTNYKHLAFFAIHREYNRLLAFNQDLLLAINQKD